MNKRLVKLIGLSMALVLFALAAGDSTQIGLAQAGKTITVCASGCDFAKIQQAIDTAAGGDTIQVQAGTYQENLTIRNKDGLTLKGTGADQVTLDGNGPQQQQNIIPGILILSSRNITVTGFKITNSRRGLEADDTTLLFIEANTFEKNLRAGILLQRSQAQIKNNTVQATQVDLDGANGVGISLYEATQAVLTDNVITENADCGLSVRRLGSKLSQASGSNNTIQNNKGGDLCGSAPTSLLAKAPAEGTLDQVAVPADAPTIQEAVNKVKAGGTITVAAGTYKEQVQIYKSLKLVGAGLDQTVLQAPSPEWVALNLASSDPLEVTLEGLRITGGLRGAMLATGQNGAVTLRKVKIDGNSNGKPSDGGIWVFEQVSATFDQATITGNNAIGLWVFGQAQVTVQNSTITNNTSTGISVSDSNTATISQSTISDNGAAGISVSTSSNATIDGNTIARNVEEGIFVGATARAQITNNQISASKPTLGASSCCGFGINLRTNAQATIQGNTISQNASAGIRLQEASQATIQKNTISDNKSRGGIVSSGTSHATIEDNTISRNVITGIDARDTADLTITKNRLTDNKPDTQGNFGRGINLQGSSRATISDNTISGNPSTGVIAMEASRTTITNNTVTNNGWGMQIGAGSFANETVQAEISSNKIQNNSKCGITTDNDPGIKITGRSNTISGNTPSNLCGTTSKFPAGFGGGK